MDINELTLQSIQNYYKVLEETGYMDYTQVYKLLLLTFVNYILNEFNWYITDEDYSKLSSIINCIGNSTCFVPYSNIPKHRDPLENTLDDALFRESEESIIRLSEGDLVRLANL